MWNKNSTDIPQDRETQRERKIMGWEFGNILHDKCICCGKDKYYYNSRSQSLLGRKLPLFRKTSLWATWGQGRQERKEIVQLTSWCKNIMEIWERERERRISNLQNPRVHGERMASKILKNRDVYYKFWITGIAVILKPLSLKSLHS